MITFNNIHGTDRKYVVLTKGGRHKSFQFAISGFYCMGDPKKEKRFRQLLEAYGLKYIYTDVRF